MIMRTLRTPQASKAAQEVVVDTLLNFETVKLFACEAAETGRFDALSRTYASLQVASQD